MYHRRLYQGLSQRLRMIKRDRFPHRHKPSEWVLHGEAEHKHYSSTITSVSGRASALPGITEPALQTLMDGSRIRHIDDASKSSIISLLDSPRKKKARRKLKVIEIKF